MLPRLPVSILLLSLAVQALAEAPAGSPNATEPASRSPLAERSDEQSDQLARRLDEQAHWLKAEGETFLALWRPANAAEAKGVVILLPDEGQHADWPGGIGPLRNQLPDHGWNTLSLTLPDPEPAPLQTAEPGGRPPVEAAAAPEPAADPAPEAEPAEPAPEPEPEPEPEEAASPPPEEPAEAPPAEDTAMPKAPLSHAERVAARIEAALTFAAAQNGGPVTLAGQGTGAYWVLRFKADNAVAKVSRLALIAPRQPKAQSTRLEELLAGSVLPVGDFYFREGDGIALAKQRRDITRRGKHPAYHQVGLTPLPADRLTEQARLTKRIRGWLERRPPN